MIRIVHHSLVLHVAYDMPINLDWTIADMASVSLSINMIRDVQLDVVCSM